MDKEQLDLIIRAAQVLQEKKELYDYLVIILPILTAVIGWFAAIWSQSHFFIKNTKKEHYYIAREKVELIVDSYNKFLEYVYRTRTQIKNDANLKKILDEDNYYDFITEYQFQLASLHQKLRIIFPGKQFSTEGVIREMKLFEEYIWKMGYEIVNEQAKSNFDIFSLNKQIEDLHAKMVTNINNITKAVVNIQTEAIKILTSKAKKLGIED